MLDLTELLALLDTADWQQRLVVAARCEPGLPDDEAIRLLPGVPSWFALDRLTRIDRALAVRYLPVLLRRELAYGTQRLDPRDARRATELFLAPFGPETRFYATIALTPELVIALDERAPCGYACAVGVFGSTLESAIFAVDPDGVVGCIDIGDED